MRGIWRRLRWLRWPVYAALLVAILAASPIPWVEARCVSARVADAKPYVPILAEAHRRNEVDTYLTYPEWSIVHAYEDFAAVLRQSAESDFGYFDAISGYWSNLCAVMRIASQEGEITADMRAMLYIIGTSFGAEMGVKGLYERTIGALTEFVRGPERTAEDTFALSLAEDYARFLRQTPWYEYPFGTSLARLWREVPWKGTSWTRSIERRIALTLELGVKAVYARAMGLLAGVSPAKLTIRSVVRGANDATLAKIANVAGVTLIERRADRSAVIETPRYREFTEILRAIVAAGGEIVEIAGNDDVFVTLLTAAAEAPRLEPARTLFESAVQSRPGWRRMGVATKVSGLAALLRRASTPMLEFEHVYDY